MGQAKIPMVSSLRALATLAVLLAGSSGVPHRRWTQLTLSRMSLSCCPRIQTSRTMPMTEASPRSNRLYPARRHHRRKWQIQRKMLYGLMKQRKIRPTWTRMMLLKRTCLVMVTVPTQLPVVVLDFGADADAHHTDADADVAEQHADADTPYGADADVQITVADVQITVVGALSITGADAQHVAGAQPVAGARAQLARRRIEGRSR